MVLSIGTPGSNAVQAGRMRGSSHRAAAADARAVHLPCGCHAHRKAVPGRHGMPGRRRRPQSGPRPSGLQPGPGRPRSASCWIRRSLPVSSQYGHPCRGYAHGLAGSLFRGAIVSMRTGSASLWRDPARRRPAPGRRQGRRCQSVVSQKAGAGTQRFTKSQTRHCSRPCRKMSCGRSMPMKTILLWRFSSAAHWGPRSLPMSWCTPWKITLRSVPCMFSTPL